LSRACPPEPAAPYPHSFPTRRSSDLIALNLSSSPGFTPSMILLTNPVETNSSTEIRLLIIRASFALEGPSLCTRARDAPPSATRSEEHTSELQSRGHLVCRLLLEQKK